MMIVAIILILLACVLITLGRASVRRARRLQPHSAPRRRAHFLGWSLVLAGVVSMIAGVVSF